jgi:uncharacterized membrane protein
MISTLTTYIITKDIEQINLVSIIFNITATAAYYNYERLWGTIDWGRKTAEEPRDLSQ